MLKQDEFSYRRGVLACEKANLSGIAEIHGTPAYIYSRRAIVSRFREYEDALAGLPHHICFSVKANSNLAVLRALASEGAWFDIVSGGELYRVLSAGSPAGCVVFSGVGKTEAEIRFALEQGIHSFNCESEAEIETISRIASSLGRDASIAIRVNPDVDPATHPYISTGLREHKFGIDIACAEAVYHRASQLPGVVPEGVSCHIGSQILDAGPLLETAEKAIALIERLCARGLRMRYLDLGGGLGVPYRPAQSAASIPAFIQGLREKLSGLDLALMLEPGRSIVAEAGVLLTRVLLVKQNGGKTFVIVDAAMNDLIRPALYRAHHEIIPVKEPAGGELMEADIAGPICETGDFFARHRQMPHVTAGDLLAICTAGAYGFVSASNYNSRPRPCEVLVEEARVLLVRKRETYEDLIRGESLDRDPGAKQRFDPSNPNIVHTDLEDDRLTCHFRPGSA
ncbi:MAG: diaminopimelate decarboxylase [Acidobacteriaceae bacterium]|nr:diaminopimelate decarboxylase [Acidobacteriaceae bacterium]MBV9779067.1 diaminopimelate decarboxylase [Acidobacteriaceae bacterium]